jgi:hypothetical protein
MPVKLKDGSEVEDRQFDRIIQFDERSRGFPIRKIVWGKKPRSYDWRIHAPFIIDQGREGACVGFAETNELQARPSEVSLGDKAASERFAIERIYYEAQKIDPWPGGAYPGASPVYDGTSVLAGIKVAHSMGYFEEYRWSFGLRGLVLGIGYNGPAVIGIWWYDTNYTPDVNGYISPKGNKVGGHALLIRAVKIVWREGFDWDTHGWDALDLDASFVTIRNSWGAWGYKKSGDCFVTLRNIDKWLDNDGEAAFMVNRRTVPSPTS